MPVYTEKPEKLKLQLSGTQSDVSIRIDCYHGTVAVASYYMDGARTLNCGQDSVIAKSSVLRGKTKKINGNGNNPDGGPFKVVHTIQELGGNQLVYTFPDDYTGNPEYDEADENPSYSFKIIFI